MHYSLFSYRFAQEILEHNRYRQAWSEITQVLRDAPLFTYPGKSSNKRLDVVQQALNTYFERRFAVDFGWDYHPRATLIEDSGLAADFRKDFPGLVIQVEVQFGNMARWYSDVFKFQTAYAQKLIHMGLCIVPMSSLARRVDSNVVNYERVIRELPAAEMSLTLPILVAGIEPDVATPVVDLSACQFNSISDVTRSGGTDNRWRIVNGYIAGVPMGRVGPDSEIGRTVGSH